ncbi:MAG: tetratricopeptide repeat protein [Aphanothece sp. CMT-3BRIN-NPC111]|jgi:beta-fructofuranosidase|nr:tetratricopeptide repeat protein [Aphanothece sp. CMT-3BRIN-NPC111]
MECFTLQQQAAKYLNQGQYREAIALYEQCLDANPTWIQNYWHLGLGLLLQGEESMAQAVWLSVLVEGSPEEIDNWTAELVKILAAETFQQLQGNNWHLAERICKQILELDSTHAETYLALGIVYLNWEQLDEAIAYLQKAIEIQPDLPEAYYNLGMCLRLKGCNIEQAINQLQKAIELKPELSEAYNNLAMCFMSQGEIELAINYLQKAIELKPNLPGAYNNLAMCLIDKGEIEPAISNLQQAISIDPSFIEASYRIEEIMESEQAGYSLSLRKGYGVWDPWLLKDDNVYRLFYLTGDRKATPFWSVGEVGAATSTDLKTWKYLGIVLKPALDSQWESGRILAGNVYKENGIYYLFYAASPPQPLILQEGIGLATSVDGLHWERRSTQFLQLDPRFYGYTSAGVNSSLYQEVKHFAWRDPYIVKEPDTGKYYMFITACVQSMKSNFKGCIAVAVADKIDGAYEVLAPAAYPLIEETEEGIFYEMERPQVIYKDGKYYMFFSTHPQTINPKWLAQVGTDRITDSSLYWYVSDKITGPFKPVVEKPVVKGSEKTGLYATNLISGSNGDLIAYGAHTYTFTLEVSPRFPVRWENGSIEILLS